MSYTPINWQTGDTITAEKLNKMDNGWGATNAQLFSGSITMTEDNGYYYAELSYSDFIDADSLTVTFDGTEYVCPKYSAGDIYYGALFEDYSVYPFGISSSAEYGNYIDTQTGGTHSVTAIATTIETGEEFKTAVAKADPSFQIILGQTTWQEAFGALNAGREVYVLPDSGYRVPILYVGTQWMGDYTDYIACGVRINQTIDPVTAVYHASSSDGVLQ